MVVEIVVEYKNSMERFVVAMMMDIKLKSKTFPFNNPGKQKNS